MNIWTEQSYSIILFFESVDVIPLTNLGNLGSKDPTSPSDQLRDLRNGEITGYQGSVHWFFFFWSFESFESFCILCILCVLYVLDILYWAPKTYDLWIVKLHFPFILLFFPWLASNPKTKGKLNNNQPRAVARIPMNPPINATSVSPHIRLIAGTKLSRDFPGIFQGFFKSMREELEQNGIQHRPEIGMCFFPIQGCYVLSVGLLGSLLPQPL